MATTCGSCVELISDSQQITCLRCQTNFHLACAEGMMENGLITSCTRCQNVTLRKKESDKRIPKSVKSSSGSKKSTKSAQVELDRLKHAYELQQRQFAEREELLTKRHQSEVEYLKQQTLLLQQNDENDTSTSADESIAKVEEWMHKTEGNTEGKGILDDQRNHEKTITSTKEIQQSSFSITGDCIAARKVIEKDLPKFSGKPLEWPFFFSVYESSTKACKYSNEENLSRLRNCLEGSAHAAVKSYLMFPDLVPRVMDTLQKYFGKPEFIMNDIIKDIRETPGPKIDDAESVINYSMKIDNLCLAMKFCKFDPTMWSSTILYEVTYKLPTTMQYEWGLHKLKSVDTNVNINLFSDWLQEKSTVFASILSTAPLVTRSKNNNNRNRIHMHTEEDERRVCLACGEFCPKIAECTFFQELSYKDKMMLVNKKHLCFLCLKRHRGKCTSGIKCDVADCAYHHNTLLHKPAENLEEQMNHHTHSHYGIVPFFKVLPVVLFGDGVSIKTYAFLDDGSSLTVVEESLCDELNLEGPAEDLCIKTTGKVSRIEKLSKTVNLQISPSNLVGKRFNLNNVRTVKDLNLPTQTLDVTKMKSNYPHLEKVPVSSFSARPRILIGLNNSKLLLTTQNKVDNKSDIIASKTCLGWVIYGFEAKTNGSLYHLCECQKNTVELNELVKNHYTLESAGINSPYSSMTSPEVERAQQILRSTTVFNNGFFECGLLWRFEEICLPQSFNMAFQRLKCLEKKLSTDQHVSKRFHEIISEYRSKGYIRELTMTEIKGNPKCWYLPIFTVKNPNKPEKLRIVWDAAAKVRGTSLNDVLLKGPDLIVDLPGVLSRFRERRIAIAGDIAEMFHQVRTKAADQQFQRFLYRESVEDEPKHFAMTVMTFGAACSPCIAQHVKNTNAERFQITHPRAVMSIKENHYVDDMLDCGDSEDEVIQLAKDVQNIHAKGGFNIRGWVSNSQRVVKELGGCNQQHKSIKCDDGKQLATEKVLGMFWNTDDDCFRFSLKFNKGNSKVLKAEAVPTKREVLKIIMSIYDPLGLIGHCIVFAKILMQRLWRLKLQWDDPIPKNEFDVWKVWIASLSEFENISIPRWYGTTDDDDIQMHVFTDASEDAYSAVAYLRIKNGKGVHCSLLGSKTRVAPIKSLTVPRLELLAAVTGVRLATSIQSSLTLKLSKIIFWSDSMTVLSWISSDTRNYKQFVASRIYEILDSTVEEQWRYIPSKKNVADDSTRMVLADLSNDSRWFRGPDFLYGPESDWPTRQLPSRVSEELRPHALGFLNFHCTTINIEDYSCWEKLIRVHCYVLRFIRNMKARNRGSHIAMITREELIEGEVSLLKHAQSQYYADEIALLERNEGIPKSSEIYNVIPYLDSNQLLRCNGRLQSSNVLSPDTKNPIILPRGSHITNLVLLSYHMKFLHINHETAINETRQKFFIINLRAAMKTVRKNCQYCKNKGATPAVPMMSPLPEARLSAFIRPFSFVGVDYFGPLYISVGRHLEKRWGVLFTCMSVRAIHLEIAHSLTTDSCVQSILRFIFRRGQPVEFFSDNGTNLRGASKELLLAVKDIDRNVISERFTTSSTSWNFNPPLSPHMGGAWEVMVRLVKRCLEGVMPSRNPNEELLQTVFSEVEFIVNSRPLSYIPIEHENSEAITPNHLILGSSSGVKPFATPSDEQELLKNSWKKCLQIGDFFWKRFVKEVLPTLLHREKWRDPVRELKVGDIVLVMDELNSKCEYPKGRVLQIHPSGKDGIIRKATVQTSSGVYVRPAAKLAILQVEKNTGTTSNELEAIPGGSDNSTAIAFSQPTQN